MNYSLNDLPDSGKNPVVFMDITLKEECLGRIYIKLFRDVFPAGVENFVRIASGQTFRSEKKGSGPYKYSKEIRRTFDGSKFYNFLFNNYLVGGDIYNNDGSNAGTIYCDQPIPPCFGDFYYPHDRKGLVSLVPFRDDSTGQVYYDSTFMITLDDGRPSNLMSEMDCDQVVIGQVYDGLCVLDRMNQLIKPYAGRRYPEFVIARADVQRTGNSSRRKRPGFNCCTGYQFRQCPVNCGATGCGSYCDDTITYAT